MPYFGVLPDYSASSAFAPQLPGVMALGPDRVALQNKIQAGIHFHKSKLSEYAKLRNEKLAAAASAQQELFALNSSKDSPEKKKERAQRLARAIAKNKAEARDASEKAKKEDAALAKLTNDNVGLLSDPAMQTSQVTSEMAKENNLEMPPLPVDDAKQVADAIDAAQKAAQNALDAAKKPGVPAWMYLAGAGVGALLLRKLLK